MQIINDADTFTITANSPFLIEEQYVLFSRLAAVSREFVDAVVSLSVEGDLMQPPTPETPAELAVAFMTESRDAVVVPASEVSDPHEQGQYR
ncbi:hypothetical protein [Mycobacterium sp. 3519A]|uniref:hypothetical protein n=1 Tax=Mycobacterium sp. 3519A TaxID=2057184 RepID=UPI00115B67E0|nr:hypothetical protein [Mycobacterium sp. 3519A]